MTPVKIPETSGASDQIRIWDLPLRLFHVLLACSVTGAIIAVKLGDNWMEWHVRLGIISLALLTFRLVWGVVGSQYARFSQFVRSPRATLAYLRQANPPTHKTAGHNPLGAWSVLAMLFLLSVQATTGLFTSDDVMTQGPLVSLVSETTGSLMTSIHEFNAVPIYIILGLHLLAIVFYTLKKHALIKPMIMGDVPADQLPPATVAANDGVALRLFALVLAGVIATGAYYLIKMT